MRDLAATCGPEELAESPYGLYEQFRPEIRSGKRGGGQKGELDLDRVRSPARRA